MALPTLINTRSPLASTAAQRALLERCRSPANVRGRPPPPTPAARAHDGARVAGQPRQALQPGVPSLPRRRRPRSHRGDERRRSSRPRARRAGAIRHPDARHHRRRAGTASALPRLVARARALGRHVIDRCNLTITTLPNYASLPEFLPARRGGDRLAPVVRRGADRSPARRRRVRASIAALRGSTRSATAARAAGSCSTSSPTRWARSFPPTRPRSSATGSAS
jgi:hypothetical protein